MSPHLTAPRPDANPSTTSPSASPHPRPHRPSFTSFSTSPPSTATATADPSHRPPPPHSRPPSLGALHQELESEQEAQVNRLLLLIRRQREEIAELTRARMGDGADGDVAVEESDAPLSPLPPLSPQPASSGRRSFVGRAAGSGSGGAPHVRPPSSARSTSGARDEATFYQAETAALGRENVVLRQRIRELERLLHAPGAEAQGSGGGLGGEDAVPKGVLAEDGVAATGIEVDGSRKVV